MFRGRSNALSFLGLPENAKHENVKRAYKKLALRLHPDKGGSENAFKRLRSAMNMLGNGAPSYAQPRPSQPRPPQQRPPKPRPPQGPPTIRVKVLEKILKGPVYLDTFNETDYKTVRTRDFTLASGSSNAPTLTALLDRIRQEDPAMLGHLKNGFRVFNVKHTRAGMFRDFNKTQVGYGNRLFPFREDSNSMTNRLESRYVVIEIRKQGQRKMGWMFLDENPNAHRRRAEAGAQKNRKKAGENASHGVSHVVNVEFWGPSTSGAAFSKRFEFPEGTRPTVGTLIGERFARDQSIRAFLGLGFRILKFSSRWHPKYKGKDHDAFLDANNVAGGLRLIVLARQPGQQSYGWTRF